MFVKTVDWQVSKSLRKKRLARDAFEVFGKEVEGGRGSGEKRDTWAGMWKGAAEVGVAAKDDFPEPYCSSLPQIMG